MVSQRAVPEAPCRTTRPAPHHHLASRTPASTTGASR